MQRQAIHGRGHGMLTHAVIQIIPCAVVFAIACLAWHFGIVRSLLSLPTRPASLAYGAKTSSALPLAARVAMAGRASTVSRR